MYSLETKLSTDTLVLKLLLGTVFIKVFTSVIGVDRVDKVSFYTQLEKNNANDIP